MKNIIYILFVLIGMNVSAQEWRDSLKVARDSYKKQDYVKALKYYQSAQKKAPNDVDLSDEMGQSAYKAREFEKAEKIYEQNANSKKSKSAKAKSYHNMGNSRMKGKNYQGAVESYKEALRNNPSDDETRYNLSEAIRRLKDEQKKNPKDNKDSKDKNQPQNKPQNPKGKQNPKDNKNQKNQQNSPNQQNNAKDGKEQDGKNPSRLPNKSVERMLDQLMKSEAETKRKMGGSRQEGNTIKSGKDW